VPWRWEAGILTTASVGQLPGLAPGVGAFLGVTVPGLFPLVLDVGYSPEQEASGGGGRVAVDVQAVGISVCPIHASDRVWSGAVCLLQQVGRLGATGYGFDRTESRTRIHYALGVRLRGGARVVGPLLARLGLGAEAPLARDRFVYERPDGGAGALFRPDPVIGVAEVGLGIEF
jgi:hypothetical protein